MFRYCDHRLGHYVLLLGVASLLFFPNLGAPSLWDVDEGNNSEAAREMSESGNWIVPTFNYQLRVDKPALLYWLQIGAYTLFGVNEFGARFPSALAALVTVLLTYELGRRLFDAMTGLLAGVVLASTVLFCGVGHFANPDALLNLFTVLTLFIFWCRWAADGRLWSLAGGASSGLAVLAKGPVGIVLPLAVVGLFLLWSRQVRRLLDWRFLWATLAFAVVTLPWYVLVGVETRAVFLRDFFLTHNVNRFLSPMEGHRGPSVYYLGVLAVGFAPWSVFLALAAWYGRGRATWADRTVPTDSAMAIPAAYRFLWCWLAVYFVFFTLAGTKLPNYAAPLFPPAALLTARFLERWRRGALQPPAWALPVGLASLAVVGVSTIGIALVAGGTIPAPFLQGRALPGLSPWAVLGIVPITGAWAGWWCARRRLRGGVVTATALSAVLFVGSLAAWGGSAVEAYKAPRFLAGALPADQEERDIRVGSYHYFQPSLVFYCRREVSSLLGEPKALEFLRRPLPVYLIVPAVVWQEMEARVQSPHRVLARRRDLYRNYDVVLVTNDLLGKEPPFLSREGQARVGR
jgi:4-amino-4-deoxy-L-arabinose transferase-like glycosyltransferase